MFVSLKISAIFEEMIKGIAFDLDGTLTKPAIDFEALRRKIGNLKTGIPIYEQALEMPEQEKKRALTILEETELSVAKKAEPNPGVYELINYLSQKKLRKAIFTRNSRKSLDITLSVLNISGEFSPVVTREDVPRLKPAPDMIFYILRDWNFSPEEVLVVGDFVFDVMAGKAAGCKTVLVNHNQLFLPGLSPFNFRGHKHNAVPDYQIFRLEQIICILEDLNGQGPCAC